MTEHLIACGGATVPPGRSRVLALDLGTATPEKSRVMLKLGSVTAQLVSDFPEILIDALEVAAYVYSADRLLGRGPQTLPEMGGRWRRQLHFVIPVRQRARWADQQISQALVDALSFLTEDDFAFEFVEIGVSGGIAPYLEFQDPDAQVIVPDDVMLFSGGIDSLGGALDTLIGAGRRCVLVTHRSSTAIANRQNELLDALRSRTEPKQLFWLPVWVTRGNQTPIEHTQRSRAFLFATLGVVMARMFDRTDVLMFENGVTSFNLPVAEHVIGSRASRTTHPRVLHLFAAFFSALLGQPIAFKNPFIWKTKREVVDLIASYGCADLIPLTVSCAAVRDLAMTGKHCGVCSQCLERRFSILSAGLEEPADTYALDVFAQNVERIQDVTMVEQYVLQALRRGQMSELAFLGANGAVFRALSHLSGPAAENARRVFDLHRRHGRAVVEVVDRELSSLTLLRILELPPKSLLAMINSTVAPQLVETDLVANEPRPSVEAAADRRPIPESRMVIALDEGRGHVLFDHEIELRGANAALVRALANKRRAETERGVPSSAYAYVDAAGLAALLSVEEPTLRKQVQRARRALAQQFLERADRPLGTTDVIDSDSWKGYRLNPNAVLVLPAQLAPARHEVSRLGTRSVTTRAGRP